MSRNPGPGEHTKNSFAALRFANSGGLSGRTLMHALSDCNLAFAAMDSDGVRPGACPGIGIHGVPRAAKVGCNQAQCWAHPPDLRMKQQEATSAQMTIGVWFATSAPVAQLDRASDFESHTAVLPFPTKIHKQFKTGCLVSFRANLYKSFCPNK